MQELILVILAVLVGSAIFSGSEAALFSVPVSRARLLAQQKKRGAESLLKVKENIRRPITVIVILNNIFNIVGSILVGVIAAEKLDSSLIGVMSAILTILIIIFGEIIPKSIGENYAEKITLTIAKPLLISTKIFFPFVWFIEKITAKFTKDDHVVSEEEIRLLSHLGHLEGVIEKDEEEMIQKVFKLNDLKAKDIMTPRTVVDALEGNKTVGELAEDIYKLSHSRIPIYNEDLDDITGICQTRDLLIALGKDEKDRKVSEFSREAVFVAKDIKLDKLLPFFQEKKRHLAVVKDEFGGTSGIVTLEDILEELVGEIVDETDQYTDLRKEAAKEGGKDKVVE